MYTMFRHHDSSPWFGEPNGFGVPNPERYRATVLSHNPLDTNTPWVTWSHKIPFYNREFSATKFKYSPKWGQLSVACGTVLQPQYCGKSNDDDTFRVFTPVCEVVLSGPFAVDVRICTIGEKVYQSSVYTSDERSYRKRFYDGIRQIDCHAKPNIHSFLFGWKVERQIWMGHFQPGAEPRVEKFCGWSILPKDIVLRIINLLYTNIPYNTAFTTGPRPGKWKWDYLPFNNRFHPASSPASCPYLRFSYKGGDIPMGSLIVASIRYGGLFLAPKHSHVKPIWTIDKVFYKFKGSRPRKITELDFASSSSDESDVPVVVSSSSDESDEES